MRDKFLLWLTFMLGSTLGYRGAAPVWAVAIVATLLTLPRLATETEARTLSLTTAVSAANALLFAGAAYVVGRVIAWLLVS
jgi:hypothetical protein